MCSELWQLYSLHKQWETATPVTPRRGGCIFFTSSAPGWCHGAIYSLVCLLNIKKQNKNSSDTLMIGWSFIRVINIVHPCIKTTSCSIALCSLLSLSRRTRSYRLTDDYGCYFYRKVLRRIPSSSSSFARVIKGNMLTIKAKYFELLCNEQNCGRTPRDETLIFSRWPPPTQTNSHKHQVSSNCELPVSVLNGKESVCAPGAVGGWLGV